MDFSSVGQQIGYWLTHVTQTFKGGYSGSGENGFDVGIPYHTPVYAIQSGPVLGTGYYGGGGVVSIQMNPTQSFYYQHLSDITVSPGQHVNAGQLIGYSGGQIGYGDHPATCCSGGPHIEVGINAPFGGFWKPLGANIDPMPYVRSLANSNAGTGPAGTPQNPALAAIQQAGFTGTSATIAAAIAMAESGLQANATHLNTDGSIDRGLFQINNRAHPEVSDSCAFNLQCAAQAAFKISNGGTDFSQWSTYTGGQYKQYLSQFSTLGLGTATSSGSSGTQDCGPMPGIVDIATNSAAWIAWLGCQSSNAASGVSGAGGGLVSMAGQLMSWIGGGVNNIQAILPFIKDPVRILKLITGIGLVFVASIAIFLPDIAAIGVAAVGAPELAPAVRSGTKQAMSGHPVRAASNAASNGAQHLTTSIQKQKTTRQRAQRRAAAKPATAKPAGDAAPKGHGATNKPALGGA